MIREENIGHSSLSEQIAAEVARILRETTLTPYPTPPLHAEWVSLPEAARILGYSTSRFYHIYNRLGLVASRTSKRKIRFLRKDIENLQILCQTRHANQAIRRRVSPTAQSGTKSSSPSYM